MRRKTRIGSSWTVGLLVLLTLLLAACGGQTSGGGGGGSGGGGGGGGSSNTVTVRQTDSGPLLGAYYRVGGGSWQTLSFSNGQATFTATGDYEVAVRCQSGPNVSTDVYLFKATTSQASALSFACTSSGGSSSSSPRTFQVSLPTSIGSYTIQTGDIVSAGPRTATYTGSNPVTLQNVFFPDGSQDVLFTVLRVTGGFPPTSSTPIGYKLVNLNLVGGGPFDVDATGWRPFAATRAIGLNLPPGYQGSASVYFFRNGMKSPTISGLLDRYGLLQEQGKYLGSVFAGRGYGDSLITIKDTGGNDWTPSLMSPWAAGQFSVNNDTLTFTHPNAQFYQVSLDGFINGLRAQITVYPSGGSTTYTVPVVPGLNYALADYSSRSVTFDLLAVRGSLAQLALFLNTAPSENNLSGLDLANAQRYGSFTGASYTLP